MGRCGIDRSRAVLRRVAALLEQRTEDIAQLMSAEEGKAIVEARVEVNAAAETFYYHAGRARSSGRGDLPSSHPDELIRTIRIPVGTVAVTHPWNFPYSDPGAGRSRRRCCGETVWSGSLPAKHPRWQSLSPR